jgi:aminoglycoside 3-N-acetyltransferase
MSEADAIRRSGRPLTARSLRRIFETIGIERGDVLVVHSSLGALGWVCGGAVAVIEALLLTLTSEGTLVMPAHSAGLTEPSAWRNPPVPESWWEEIRRSMPPFDAARTPTLAMGVVPELFRTWPGVLRSAHPTSSMAAFGKHAEDIVADHPLDDPMGERSPLGRVYELDGKVLLLGVGHDSNTSLHLAERKAFGATQRRVKNGSPILVNGERKWIEYEEPLACTDDFIALGAAFEADSGNVTRAGPARVMSQRALVDFGAAWLREHRAADGTICSDDPGRVVGHAARPR